MKSIIVVADSSIARVFSADSVRSPLKELIVLENEAGHEREHSLTSDVPGKIAANDHSHHAYQAHETPKEHAKQQFAKDIVSFVQEIYQLDGMAHLLVIASPGFLGELRKAMPAGLKAHIIFENPKNLTKMSPGTIRAHLLSYLETSL